MEKSYIQIGKIINTHGIRGEIKVYPLTNFPERFKALKEIVLISPEKPKRLLIERVRFQNTNIILKLKEYNSISEVEKLKGLALAIPEEKLWPLKEDEYYHFQILGLKVHTTDGLFLGIIKDIFSTGGSDVYSVKMEDKEYLIPAIKEIIKEINLETGKMIICAREGLLNS